MVGPLVEWSAAVSSGPSRASHFLTEELVLFSFLFNPMVSQLLTKYLLPHEIAEWVSER
jgi:hypothetical protein